MVKKDNKSKALTIVSAVAIAAAGVVGGFVLDTPNTIVEQVIEYQNISVPGETLYVNVPVEVKVEKIVEIENEDMDLVLNYLEDNYGDELVFEDVRDIIDNIKMEDSYKNKALDLFEANFKDEISVPRGYKLSDASLENIRDEIVSAIDYEDKEFVVTFEAEVLFEDDDSKVTRYYDVTYDFDLDRDDVEDIEVSVVLQ